MYKVEVEKDNVEYDVYIEASTGKVSSVNQDDNNDDDFDDHSADDKNDDNMMMIDDDGSYKAKGFFGCECH